MSLNTILAKLDKVKKSQRGYMACCPVHNDKNPSMTITESDDGKVLCHCFSCGARGSDVVEAIGLPMGELFSGEFTGTYDPKHKLRKTELEDSLVISMYEDGKRNGQYLSHADFKRYKLAKARIEQLQTY